MPPRNLTRSAHGSPGPVPGPLTASRPPASTTEDPHRDPRPPKLLDQVRLACRLRHLSDRTEEAYVGWIRRFILFHNKRHPATMAAPDVASFLSSLATDHHVSASTQNQAPHSKQRPRYCGLAIGSGPVSRVGTSELEVDEVQRRAAA